MPACELLVDYESQRKERVKIGNVRRSWANLHKGDPQGSILGILLFDLFIDDLFLFLEKYSLYNYADENNVSYLGPCLCDWIKICNQITVMDLSVYKQLREK